MSQEQKASNIIFVKDIPQGIHPQEFEDLFSRLPGYITMRRKPYFAFIEFKDKECSTNAMRKYQAYKFHSLDRPLIIEYDKDSSNSSNINNTNNNTNNNNNRDSRTGDRDYRDSRDSRDNASYMSSYYSSSTSSSYRGDGRDDLDQTSNETGSLIQLKDSNSPLIMADKDYEQGMIIEKDLLDDEEREEKHKSRASHLDNPDSYYNRSNGSSRVHNGSLDYPPPHHNSHHHHPYTPPQETYQERKRYRDDRYQDSYYGAQERYDRPSDRSYPPYSTSPYSRSMPPYMPHAGPTLYVSNLPRDVTERELSILFRFMRGFIGIRLINKDGRQPICFCDFDNVQSAGMALEALQGFRMDPKVPSSSISIEFDKSNSTRIKH
ncbi:RNA-binding region RNP-1 domain-containing protein [Tieghemostelium lacteum]|uniref:RNA-binding region RNP-1 domain-containing protein n=1 Tax=Tieghemostelium lacteum TaxID=361077 RepID=A0A151ZBS4_TIELA|nr:RNA-binding region RNP-1 domain-containing protein [Tieghemostelium lacteum]|eukprot:KYQ91389.1 RNA-binding region RNP-1 domain-containing protein [Tieghemostelium lacteum]